MERWYQSPFNNRHPKTKHECQAQGPKGYITLDKNTVVQPIRKIYINRYSWIKDVDWGEDTHVACYIEQKGGTFLIKADDIDFTK